MLSKNNLVTSIEVYRNRRNRLLAALHEEGGGIAILSTSVEIPRNRDINYPYRHDSYFYYLTGFTEPDATLILNASANNNAPKSILFCRDKNPDRENWEGFQYGPLAARDIFQFDAAFKTSELDNKLLSLFEGVGTIYYRFNTSSNLINHNLNSWINALKYRSCYGKAMPHTFRDLSLILDDMRIIKDRQELEIMRRAAKISALAHRRAMSACHPGIHEYELEAELLYTFRVNGAQSPAYEPIVAAGSNTCILHHSSGDTVACNGDLILIDAGCELNGYASDITRTFPVNGRFSTAQRLLYDIVLSAQQAAIDKIRAGITFDELHNAAVRILAQGLLDTGIISKTRFSSVDSVISERAYLPFYMHRIGHWIGMDVHDCGDYKDYKRVLNVGMVLTIEPGLYIRIADNVPSEYWNIGIRIEDSVIVRENDFELITRDVPVNADEIETLILSNKNFFTPNIC